MIFTNTYFVNISTIQYIFIYVRTSNGYCNFAKIYSIHIPNFTESDQVRRLNIQSFALMVAILDLEGLVLLSKLRN